MDLCHVKGKKEGSRVCLPESSAKVNGTFKVAITVNNEMIFMPYAVSFNSTQVYNRCPFCIKPASNMANPTLVPDPFPHSKFVCILYSLTKAVC